MNKGRIRKFSRRVVAGCLSLVLAIGILPTTLIKKEAKAGTVSTVHFVCSCEGVTGSVADITTDTDGNLILPEENYQYDKTKIEFIGWSSIERTKALQTNMPTEQSWPGENYSVLEETTLYAVFADKYRVDDLKTNDELYSVNSSKGNGEDVQYQWYAESSSGTSIKATKAFDSDYYFKEDEDNPDSYSSTNSGSTEQGTRALSVFKFDVEQPTYITFDLTFAVTGSSQKSPFYSVLSRDIRNVDSKEISGYSWTSSSSGTASAYITPDNNCITVRCERNTNDGTGQITINNFQAYRYEELQGNTNQQLNRASGAVMAENNQRVAASATYVENGQEVRRVYSNVYNTVSLAPWTIHFDKNNDDATGTMEDQYNLYSKTKLNENKFTSPYYRFAGWSQYPYTSCNDTYSMRNDQGAAYGSKDNTYYAIWEPLYGIRNQLDSDMGMTMEAREGKGEDIQYSWYGLKNQASLSVNESHEGSYYFEEQSNGSYVTNFEKEATEGESSFTFDLSKKGSVSFAYDSSYDMYQELTFYVDGKKVETGKDISNGFSRHFSTDELEAGTHTIKVVVIKEVAVSDMSSSKQITITDFQENEICKLDNDSAELSADNYNLDYDLYAYKVVYINEDGKKVYEEKGTANNDTCEIDFISLDDTATGTMKSMCVSPGNTTKTFPECQYKVAGKEFKGWCVVGNSYMTYQPGEVMDSRFYLEANMKRITLMPIWKDKTDSVYKILENPEVNNDYTVKANAVSGTTIEYKWYQRANYMSPKVTQISGEDEWVLSDSKFYPVNDSTTKTSEFTFSLNKESIIMFPLLNNGGTAKVKVYLDGTLYFDNYWGEKNNFQTLGYADAGEHTIKVEASEITGDASIYVPLYFQTYSRGLISDKTEAKFEYYFPINVSCDVIYKDSTTNEELACVTTWDVLFDRYTDFSISYEGDAKYKSLALKYKLYDCSSKKIYPLTLDDNDNIIVKGYIYNKQTSHYKYRIINENGIMSNMIYSDNDDFYYYNFLLSFIKFTLSCNYYLPDGEKIERYVPAMINDYSASYIKNEDGTIESYLMSYLSRYNWKINGALFLSSMTAKYNDYSKNYYSGVNPSNKVVDYLITNESKVVTDEHPYWVKSGAHYFYYDTLCEAVEAVPTFKDGKLVCNSLSGTGLCLYQGTSIDKVTIQVDVSKAKKGNYVLAKSVLTKPDVNLECVNGTGKYAFTISYDSENKQLLLNVDDAQYPLVVEGGSTSATYKVDSKVTITADESEKDFDYWDGLDDVQFADGCTKKSVKATFTMPTRAVTASAIYKEHSYSSWKITKEPTLTATGEAQRTCEYNAAHVDKNVLPALSDTSVWTKADYVEPTHKTLGSQKYTSIYGTVTVVIAMHTDADYGPWTMIKKPTMTETGKARRVCKLNQQHVEEVTIPALTDEKVWEGLSYAPATLTTQGKKIYTSQYGTIEVVVPALKKTAKIVSNNLLVAGEVDIKNSTFFYLQAKATKVKKNKVTLTWKPVSGATGYMIYSSKCGKNRKLKKVATVKAGKTSWTMKKLKKNGTYKFVVAAYKKNGSEPSYLAASKTIHILTSGNKKYDNPTKITVKKASVKLQEGKTYRIVAKEKTVKGKKVLTHRKISYEAIDTNIATVDKKGVISAGRFAGTTTIYVYTQNGLFRTVKITVKK